MPEIPRSERRTQNRVIALFTDEKPKDLLEYVIVHEMVHLIDPTHSDRFITLLQKHYPTWREARAELNELPLTAEAWRETVR
jgi:predicted metal-dependent hydrolase